MDLLYNTYTSHLVFIPRVDYLIYDSSLQNHS